LAEAFRATGMTHVIAISGFNIALLAGLLVSASEKLFSKRVAVVIAVLGVAIYTVLVGADASVVRAAIMGSLYLIANRWLGRPNYALASLFLAAIVMTLFNPLTLWDVGFQLSFAATLGLMLYGDPFIQWTRARLTHWLDKPIVDKLMGFLSEAVIITIAAQILTLPLMIAYFHQLSLISFLANALILPAQPGVMIWGGLATLAGMIWLPIGQVFGWVAWLFLAYTIGLVRLLAAVPWAAVPIDVSSTAVIILYIFIALVTWYSKQEPERRRQIRAVLQKNLSQRMAVSFSVLAALLTISWSTSQPDGQLHIFFLDVGQGDATLIVTPNGRQVLVDGGFYPSVLNDQLGRHMPFWDKEIDMLVATHPDADHVSGLVGVFDRYDVDYLITDGEGLGESPIYDEVLLAADREGTAVHPAQIGEIIHLDEGIHLEVLHPGEQLNKESRNENSVSMRLVYDNFTFLFTGDAEEKAEQEMLATGLPLSSLIFKAGHHGSRSSSTTPFLEAIRPQIIVVSSGADNRFGHPHPEMLVRAEAIGASILRTDQLGTIEIITDGQTMWWQSGR
jgi:competence protein ComEC